MTREEAEIVGEHPVHPLGRIGRDAHQLVGRIGDEPRIGAQERDEFGQGAVEPRLGLHLLHLGGDARDFGEADLVDLFGGQVERRVLLDLLLVVGRAIGHFLGRERGARPRQIFIAEEGEQPGVGRSDLVGDDILRFGRERRGVGGRQLPRHVFERSVERARFRIVDDVRRDGNVAPLERHPRHAEAAREPGAGIGDMLVEIARDVAHAGDVALVFLDRGEARARREVAPEIAVTVERHFPFAESRVADFLFEQGPENRRIDPRPGAERRLVESVEPREERLGLRRARQMRLGRHRRQTAAGRGAAVAFLDLMVLIELVGVVLVGQGRKPLVRAGRGRRLGRLHLLRRRWRRKHTGGDHRRKRKPHSTLSPLRRNYFATLTIAGRSRRSLIM